MRLTVAIITPDQKEPLFERSRTNVTEAWIAHRVHKVGKLVRMT